MFFPERMSKLDIIVLKKDVNKTAKTILKFGNFEVLDINEKLFSELTMKKEQSQERSERFHENRRRMNSILHFFDKQLPPFSDEERMKLEILDEDAIQSELNQIEDEINNYEHRKDTVLSKIQDFEIKLLGLKIFSQLELDLSELKNVKHFYLGFGSIPHNSFAGFVEAIDTIPSFYRTAGVIGDETLVVFAVPIDYREQTDKILKNVYYKNYGLPMESNEKMKQKMFRLSFESSLMKDEGIWLEDIYNKLVNTLHQRVRVLEWTIDYYQAEERLREGMYSSQNIAVISGWVARREIPELKNLALTVTEQRCEFMEEDAIAVEDREGVVAPTRYNNPKIFKPFELLIDMFGTPNYREIDPTPFAAILYVLMFGAMFGDVGHGFVIMSLAAIGVFMKRFKSLRAGATILLWLGFSATVFGVLYGEIFGIAFHPVWMSPIHNMMTILGLAVGFGAFLILAALILNVINSYRLKDYAKLFFAWTGLAGIGFYTGFLTIAACVLTNNPIPFPVFIVIGIAAVAMVLEKRLGLILFHHGEKESIALGAFDVVEATLSFLSNTVSFLRIGAFAINHAALMGAVFVLAEMTKNPVGYWVVLLIGNLFILGLEGLVVGIQSLRLEYYEFFIKFFRADGRKFEGLEISKKKSA